MTSTKRRRGVTKFWAILEMAAFDFSGGSIFLTLGRPCLRPVNPFFPLYIKFSNLILSYIIVYSLTAY